MKKIKLKFNKIKFVIALVLIIGSIFVSLSPRAKAASASFYLSPSSGTVKVGANISASVMISADTAINAGEGSVMFSADTLEFVSVTSY